MGWAEFILSIGLRVPNTPELVETIKSCLPEGKYPGLFLTPLDPVINGSKLTKYSDARGEFLDEWTYESCCEGKGFSLIWFNSLELECSNGFSIDTSCSYGDGHIEYLNGHYYDELSISDEHKEILQKIAEKLNIPFQLSFSLRGRGSRFFSIKFNE
jgi:hypothetical protein